MTQFDTSNEPLCSAVIPPPGEMHKTVTIDHPCRRPELESPRYLCMSACPACAPVNGVSRKSQMFDQKPEDKAVSLRDGEGAL